LLLLLLPLLLPLPMSRTWTQPPSLDGETEEEEEDGGMAGKISPGPTSQSVLAIL